MQTGKHLLTSRLTGFGPKPAYSPLSALTDRTVEMGLPDAPKDAGGINKHEVTYTPRPVFRWFGLRIVLGCDSLSLDVMPPCIHIRDEQMHHEVASVHIVIEILEQK